MSLEASLCWGLEEAKAGLRDLHGPANFVITSGASLWVGVSTGLNRGGVSTGSARRSWCASHGHSLLVSSDHEGHSKLGTCVVVFKVMYSRLCYGQGRGREQYRHWHYNQHCD